jgi:hypothetical protein
MINISNGVNEILVSRGAFENIYKAQGFIEVLEESVEEEVVEEGPTEEEIFCSDLESKPIAEWNKGEVKRYATIKDIDLAGTKGPNEAKELIKKFLNE